MTTQKEVQQRAEQLTKKLMSEGLIIEAGFLGLRIAAYNEGTPSHQLEQLREAFFAGALHVFSSIMLSMDDGEGESMSRMSNIDKELRRFEQAFKIRHGRT